MLGISQQLRTQEDLSIRLKSSNQETWLLVQTERRLFTDSHQPSGNGCCTYIKSSALTAAGYNPEEVASKTLTYDEYYKMLKDMKAASANQNFVISCSGFIAGGNSGTPEAPYTNYLPEFYQNANFTFYYDEAAKEYKDGFAQQDMKDALTRLKTAVDDGILDKASQNQTTSDARNKWNAKDASTASSVFTYWAGTWAYTLQNSIADKTDKIIAIKPIKELGSYKGASCYCLVYYIQGI